MSTSNLALLSQLGLKNSADIAMYLKSPGGKAALGMMEKEMTSLESIQNKIHLKQMKTQQRVHRLIMRFLSKLIEEESKHEKKINHAIQKEIDDKKRKKAHEDDEPVDNHETHLTIYIETVKMLEASLAKTTTESIDLEKELAQLEAELANIENRYRQYNDSLDELDTSELAPTLFQQHISRIESQMSSYARIASLLDQGKNSEAHEQQELNYTLNLKLEMLHKMKMAHQQERNFVNQLGERVPFAKDAAFFVPNDKQLTLNKGQYYLHAPSKQFDSMSPKERFDAKDAYTQAMKDMMSIKMMLQTNRTQEVSLIEQKKNSVSARSETLKQELVLLNNLINKAQEARQSLQRDLSPKNKPAPRPTPALKPAPTNLQTMTTLERQRMLEVQLRNGLATSKQVVDAQRIQPSTTLSPFNMKPKPY